MLQQFALDKAEVSRLYLENTEALLETLGLQSLPLVVSPSAALQSLRSGEIAQKDVAVQGESGFKKKSEYLINLALSFLKDWAQALAVAICKNRELYEEERRLGPDEIDLFVAAVVGAVVASVPTLAAMAGLLTVLGVLVAKTGIATFCKEYLHA